MTALASIIGSGEPSLFDMGPRKPVFDGADYKAKRDDARLTGQVLRVFDCMKDGAWKTLGEIAEATNDPQASISAQLRHLRKDKFGGHQVMKRHRGSPADGLYEYRLIPNRTTHVV